MKEEFEYIAKGAAPDKAQKLVILLHGYGFNAYAMEKLADLVVAKVPQAQLIMPHAPESYDNPSVDEAGLLQVPQILRDETNMVDDPRQWFSIQGKTLPDYAKALSDLAVRMNDFIDKKRDEAGITDRDIAIMGFSMGGAVALYTAYLRADEVACVVGHSTVFGGGENLRTKPSTLFIYGGADEEFSVARYQDVIAALQSYGVDLSTHYIPDLSHRTSHESRLFTADFIARHISP